MLPILYFFYVSNNSKIDHKSLKRNVYNQQPKPSFWEHLKLTLKPDKKESWLGWFLTNDDFDDNNPKEPPHYNQELDSALSSCAMLRQALEKTASAICAMVMQDGVARIGRIKNLGDMDVVFTELFNEYSEYPQKFAANNKALQTHMQDYTRFFSHLACEAKRLNLPDIEYNQIYVHSPLAKLNEAFKNISAPLQIGS